jgi:hypothetical protein
MLHRGNQAERNQWAEKANAIHNRSTDHPIPPIVIDLHNLSLTAFIQGEEAEWNWWKIL